MSVFKVNLNNNAQGRLDIDPSTGVQATTSNQRTVFVMGPNKINRLLVDGETFTDCNYWKRFAYPQVPLNEAIVSVLTDDGSVYSDVASENVFPAVVDATIAVGDTYGDNAVDVVSTYGGHAVFTQITNKETAGSGADIKVGLNGSSGSPSAIFDLVAGDTQIFNSGDMTISLLQFDNTASGASTDVDIQVILSVRSTCNS